MAEETVIGCILAGGESRRFDYRSKGLQSLSGRPMIAAVIDRLQSQVAELYINSQHDDYEQFGLGCFADINHPFQGPLSGLLSCMLHTKKHHPTANWLAIAPCDAPFLPTDMVNNLLSESMSTNEQTRICCYSYQNELQPTFSLWHTSLLSSLETIINEKKIGGFKGFLKISQEPYSTVEYPEVTDAVPQPFFNINTAEDLAIAEQYYAATE
ncbi:MAG: molybdenum cofactor guanylyltransferase [Arenicella sp.]